MPSKLADKRRRRRRTAARRFVTHPPPRFPSHDRDELEDDIAGVRDGAAAISFPKADFLKAVGALNEESFTAAVWMLYQTSKSAGGYRDKAGWQRVRQAAEQLPAIAALERKFTGLKAKADP